jgi:hypothetical protein
MLIHSLVVQHFWFCSFYFGVLVRKTLVFALRDKATLLPCDLSDFRGNRNGDSTRGRRSPCDHWKVSLGIRVLDADQEGLWRQGSRSGRNP